MRIYFRHARAIERRMTQSMEEFLKPQVEPVLPTLSGIRKAYASAKPSGFELRQSRISLAAGTGLEDPAHDPETVFAIFAAMARTGARLPRATEARLEDALPILSSQMEDGPGLWLQLQAILTGPFAGRALRAMHALGILELVIPEFHGIDALVIRDAYHRYTVDEHTFVLIDTLHALAGESLSAERRDAWGSRFAVLLRELPHPELLFLAALLHDTGKGHQTARHALESARMAGNVLARLEVDSYEAGMVLEIIRNHLEMSAALRRDVFDQETIRSFAARVPTPEALRMLTLFTYADITAVHPDALTPWKAENLWRLYMATSNFLDRSVDDERVASMAASEQGEVLHRVHALLPGRTDEVAQFLDGLPRRYLLTRSPEQIRAHVEMASRLAQDANQLEFHYAPGLSELTLITRDRPMLFAGMAGALAAWQMNIVTADAFSNAHGLVVDCFRFTDTFRTLELNETERERFVESVRDVMSGRADLDAMLAARRRGRRKAPKVVVESRVDFDDAASTHSTLLQVVAQDTAGLLRALSLTLAERGCNIEVALVDTEGEMAIDVFYLTLAAAKLDAAQQEGLKRGLLEAIAANAG
jgi:[protein-PII] uridylyltransferase